MAELTEETLQQALFDNLQAEAGKPFDAERTKQALVNAALAVIPPNVDPPSTLHMEEGDYRVELLQNENGLLVLRLTPIVYTIELTVDPEKTSRP